MKTSLKRDINFIELLIYGVGLILGAGIYALIGGAIGLTGNSAWLSFLIAAIIASFTGLSYAELSSMFAKSAAEYFYIKKSFKSHSLAFLVGWIEIFGDITAVSVVALGFGGYFEALFGFPMVLSALGLIVVLSLVNFIGIEKSSRLNIVFTSIEIIGLLIIIFLGLGHMGKVNYFEMPHGFSGVFKAAGLIFFAYLGFEEMVNIGEEVKKPKKNIPKALILSIIITTSLYILVALTSVSLADWRDIGDSKAPLAFVASKTFLGENAFTLLSSIALFATANTVLILLIVGSRMIYGMGKGGSFPRIFTRVHQKTRTPWTAVLTVMILSMLFVLIADIMIVANITDFVLFIVFSFVNLSLILLRYKKPHLKRPFKVPINIGKFPVIPFLGLLTSLFMLFHFEMNVILIVLSVLCLGGITYKILRLS